MVQILWRTVWQFLKKLKIELLRDLAIPLLGICLEKKHNSKRYMNTVFIAVLFTTARTRKQPKCSSTKGWIKM